MSKNDKVWMYHPRLGKSRKQEVTKEQLEKVWSAVGWKEYKEPKKASAKKSSTKKPPSEE